MEIYKGTATFAGIAIGKIRYYHRGEYEIRQYLVQNISLQAHMDGRSIILTKPDRR